MLGQLARILCLGTAAVLLWSSHAWPAEERSIQFEPESGVHHPFSGLQIRSGFLEHRNEMGHDAANRTLIAQSSTIVPDEPEPLEPDALKDLSPGNLDEESSQSGASETELTVWNDVKDSEFVDELQIYLDLYPEGVFAQLARLRIARLEDQERLNAKARQEQEEALAKTTEEDEKSLGLNRSDRRDLQLRLRTLGFDPKGIDGALGANSRLAIARWQKDNSFEDTGYLNREQYQLINDQSEPMMAAIYQAIENENQRKKSARKKTRKKKAATPRKPRVVIRRVPQPPKPKVRKGLDANQADVTMDGRVMD